MVGSALVVGTSTAGECCGKVSAGTGSAGECCDKVSLGGEVSNVVSSGMMDGVATILGNGIAGCNGISDMGKAMVSQSHIGASLSRFSPEAKYVNNTGFLKKM